jgi:hypothetical protein
VKMVGKLGAADPVVLFRNREEFALYLLHDLGRFGCNRLFKRSVVLPRKLLKTA